jgi:hypothetical protein
MIVPRHPLVKLSRDADGCAAFRNDLRAAAVDALTTQVQQIAIAASADADRRRRAVGLV